MSKFIDDMFIDVRDNSSQEVGLHSLLEMVEKTMESIETLKATC